MLDTDADRVRADTLREFVEARKQAAEAERVDAIEGDLQRVVSGKSGEIEAYETVLWFLEGRSTESEQSLQRIRDVDTE